MSKITRRTKNRYDSREAHWVPAEPVAEIVRVERDPDPASAVMVDRALSGRLSAPSIASQDTAETVARAHLIASAGYVVAVGITIAGLLLLAWLFRLMGEGGGRYLAMWVGCTGIIAILVMAVNRWQSLRHSSTGVAHHEIDARERIARHAINTHADLMRDQWGVGDPPSEKGGRR